MGVIKKVWVGVSGVPMTVVLLMVVIYALGAFFKFLFEMIASGSISADFASLIQLLEDGGLVAVGNWMALEKNNVMLVVAIFGVTRLLLHKNKEQVVKNFLNAWNKLLFLVGGDLRVIINVFVVLWVGVMFGIVTGDYKTPDGGGENIVEMVIKILGWVIVAVVGLMKVNPAKIHKMKKDYKATEFGGIWDGVQVDSSR
jgi:hypothetical protein